jgi:hypothetical protein
MLHRGNSVVAKSIRAAAEQDITEPCYDVCECENLQRNCKLATGLEGLFVAEIASRFHAWLHERRGWKFNECIYFPSTRIERKCGFDLSIGHFEQRRRVRLMHKLVQKWCDTGWDWHSKKEWSGDPKIYRCADHIVSLVQQFQQSQGLILPYLSLTACFCLHEHRRMGCDDIPAFEHHSRSLFIDLRPLAGVAAVSGRLEVKHTVDGDNSHLSARWASDDAENLDLAVSDWGAFRELTGNFLTE